MPRITPIPARRLRGVFEKAGFQRVRSDRFLSTSYGGGNQTNQMNQTNEKNQNNQFVGLGGANEKI